MRRGGLRHHPLVVRTRWLSEPGTFVRESLSEVASLSESLCHVVHEPRVRSYEKKRTVPS